MQRKRGRNKDNKAMEEGKNLAIHLSDIEDEKYLVTKSVNQDGESADTWYQLVKKMCVKMYERVVKIQNGKQIRGHTIKQIVNVRERERRAPTSGVSAFPPFHSLKVVREYEGH